MGTCLKTFKQTTQKLKMLPFCLFSVIRKSLDAPGSSAEKKSICTHFNASFQLNNCSIEKEQAVKNAYTDQFGVSGFHKTT